MGGAHLCRYSTCISVCDVQDTYDHNGNRLTGYQNKSAAYYNLIQQST